MSRSIDTYLTGFFPEISVTLSLHTLLTYTVTQHPHVLCIQHLFLMPTEKSIVGLHR